MSRATRFSLAGLLAVLLAACGPRIEAPRVDDSDYILPDLKRGEFNSTDEKSLRAAWNDVLVGQTAQAEATVRRLLVGRPDLVPARLVLGFSALRANRLKEAEALFSALVSAQPDNAVALVGLASTERKMGQLEMALPLYTKAQRLRPRDAALSRRASELKLSVAESAIDRAGALSADGRKPEAIAMLQKAIEVAPELSPVRLELADLLIESGRRTEALATLVGAPEADRNITIRIASIRLEDGDLDGAEMALKRGLRDAAEDAEGAVLLARIKDRRAALALPEPIRGIGDAARVTRAELAALVIARVETLGSRKATGNGEVASDLSRSWARPQILRALDLGIMDVYPNHTFQPTGVVRRGELAVVSARVLDLVGWGRSNAAPPRDMSPSHLQYSSVLRALAAGIMQNTASGAFEPWRIVSGAEAKNVVEALARMAAQR